MWAAARPQAPGVVHNRRNSPAPLFGHGGAIDIGHAIDRLRAIQRSVGVIALKIGPESGLNVADCAFQHFALHMRHTL